MGGKDGHYYGENAGRDDKVALRLAEHLDFHASNPVGPRGWSYRSGW